MHVYVYTPVTVYQIQFKYMTFKMTVSC